MSFLSKILAKTVSETPALDYDALIPLDAEDLAEQGIREGYERLMPELRKYVPEPAQVEELLDPDVGSYAVRCGGFEFVLYSPSLPGSEQESWGRSTYAFFTLVNLQLQGSGVLLYALNEGNDLCGIFLTPPQAEHATQRLPSKRDWPYLPKLEVPYYGQHI